MPIKCFLPCRKGSERVPRKNIKPFATYSQGLIQVKLEQLLNVSLVDQIVLSSNDDEILDFASQLNNSKLLLHRRIEALALNKTSTDHLISHALDLIPDAHILWTHVTSPFITTQDYTNILECYLDSLKNGYDSLMTATPIHSFLWDRNKPINYDRTTEKWPRTQTLMPIYEINSGIFLNHSCNYKIFNDRIGNKPFIYELSKLKGFDIDWPEDFVFAECMVNAGIATL